MYLYIIAGCNGAGKTTASFSILPEMLDCKEFVNADEIARGISPFRPEEVSLEAGRIMLNRINELLKGNQNFAFETTLSTKSHKNRIFEAKEKGFNTILIFFWLQSIKLAKERVKVRVQEGGHDVDPILIERRYKKGIINLFDIYLPIIDEALIIDNSSGKPVLIAEKSETGDLHVTDADRFNKLKRVYENLSSK